VTEFRRVSGQLPLMTPKTSRIELDAQQADGDAAEHQCAVERQIPASTVGYAIAMFGITGVGADEMTTYTCWCLEKGYARWTGPDDGTEERARRAEGWLRVMRMDVLTAWVVCTLCTLSFYIIGASVPVSCSRSNG
jgi:hypothetical protein